MGNCKIIILLYVFQVSYVFSINTKFSINTEFSIEKSSSYIKCREKDNFQYWKSGFSVLRVKWDFYSCINRSFWIL